MKVEVVTPEENMGDVMGDLNSRRGMIQGMEDTPSGKIIRAEVPLASMFGYATDLRSATQGPRELQHGVRQVQRGPGEHRRDRRQETIGSTAGRRSLTIAVDL